MSKRIKIIIAVAVLCIAAAVTVAVIKMKTESVKAQQVISDLEWGMGREEAKKNLMDKGYANYIEFETDVREYLVYQIYDYQDIKGANADMILVFENGGLSDGKYTFSPYSDDNPVADGIVAELTDDLANAYESACKESINEEYYSRKEPDDPQYGRYFVMEQSLVHIH